MRDVASRRAQLANFTSRAVTATGIDVFLTTIRRWFLLSCELEDDDFLRANYGLGLQC